MLDLRRIRSEPDAVRAALDRRGDPSIGDALDRVLALDARRRELLPELEQLRARKNEASEAIGAAKRSGEDASDAIAAMKELGAREKALSAEKSNPATGVIQKSNSARSTGSSARPTNRVMPAGTIRP